MSGEPIAPPAEQEAGGAWPSRSVLVVAFLLGLGAALALGPRVSVEERWVEPELPEDLDGYLARGESAVSDLRPGDGSGVVWADPVERARTATAFVYLHGFSADRHEVEPLVSDLARAFEANVFFTRLRGHGRTGDAMAEAAVEDWLDDVAEAVAIGERIGEQVVLIGTSTGGTLAAWAAAQPEARERLAAVVMLSPNFQPKDRTSRVLLYPWGGALARLVVGEERCFTPENDAQERHWTTCYPTSTLSTMMALAEHVRTMDLSVIVAPTLVLYSPDDGVVDAAETVRLLAGREDHGVYLQQVGQSNDPMRHVLAGDIVSPDSNAEVLLRVAAFLESVLPVLPR